MGDFFFEVTELSCFQVSYCPVKRGNRAGSSRNESDYSRRGTRISFPSRESQLREFRTSSFFNCVVRKLTVDQNGEFRTIK